MCSLSIPSSTCVSFLILARINCETESTKRVGARVRVVKAPIKVGDLVSFSKLGSNTSSNASRKANWLKPS